MPAFLYLKICRRSADLAQSTSVLFGSTSVLFGSTIVFVWTVYLQLETVHQTTDARSGCVTAPNSGRVHQTTAARSAYVTFSSECGQNKAQCVKLAKMLVPSDKVPQRRVWPRILKCRDG